MKEIERLIVNSNLCIEFRGEAQSDRNKRVRQKLLHISIKHEE